MLASFNKEKGRRINQTFLHSEIILKIREAPEFHLTILHNSGASISHPDFVLTLPT